MADKNIIEDLEMRIQGNSKSLVFARLADLYLDDGKVDEAQQICEEGIRQNPDYITGFYILAKIHLKKQNLSEAEEALKKVISHDNEYLSAHKLLGDLMLQMGFENKAAQHYKEMLRIDPFDDVTESLLKSLGNMEADYLDDIVDEEDRSSIRTEPSSISTSDDWIHEINEVFPDEEPGAAADLESVDPLAAGNDEIDEMFDTLDEKPKSPKKRSKPVIEEESFDTALEKLTETDLPGDEETSNEETPNISDTPSFVNLGDMTDEEDVLKTKDQDLADLISQGKDEELVLDEDAIAFDDSPINPNELIQNIPDLEDSAPESDADSDDWQDAFTFENIDTIEDKSEEGIELTPEKPAPSAEEETDWAIETKPDSDTVEDDAFVFDSSEEPKLEKDDSAKGDLTWDAFASEESSEGSGIEEPEDFEVTVSEDEPETPKEQTGFSDMDSITGMETPVFGEEETGTEEPEAFELTVTEDESEETAEAEVELSDMDSATDMETPVFDEEVNADLAGDAFVFEPSDESPSAIETTGDTEDSGTDLTFETELTFEEPGESEETPTTAGEETKEEISEDDLNFPNQFEDLTFETAEAEGSVATEETEDQTVSAVTEEEPEDQTVPAIEEKPSINFDEDKKSKMPPIDFEDENFKDVFGDSNIEPDDIDNSISVSPHEEFTQTTGFRDSKQDDEPSESVLEDDSRELADIVRQADQPVAMQPERDAMTPAPPKTQAESEEKEAEADVVPHKIVTPTLGEIYAAQGQFAKAIEIYEELLSQSPGEIKYRNKIDELKQKLDESL